MALTADQRKQLDAALSREHVKQRKGGQNGLSYVEGWHVIAEMNRIFGAGSWGYECTPTIAWCEQLDDGDKGKRWHVTYTASCRLYVDGSGGHSPCPPIVDYGAGHGIDKDKGLALESAIKEACTDALKRCAKSYGNVLGLALYDREQRNVAEVAEPIRSYVTDLISRIRTCEESGKRAVKADVDASWNEMTTAEQEAVTLAMSARKAKG